MIFIAGITLLAYYVFEIWHTQKSIDDALQDWDKQHLSLVGLEGLNQQNVVERDNELPPTDYVNALSAPLLAKKGEVIGKLTLERLQKSHPIIEGTDTDQLTKGVGNYTASVFPGDKGNAILAGHRDSVFRKLGELKPDDQISVETLSGTFTYLITGSKIVEVEDTSVFLSSEFSTMTLITCYPFHYVGNAPKRYLLFAKLLQ